MDEVAVFLRTIKMVEYRAYILDHDDHIVRYEPIICTDDEAAIAAAKRLVDGHDVELWQGDRKVAILAHNAI